MKSQILLLHVAAVLAFSIQAQARDISGVFKGREFEISLSDSFDSIDGHWGSSKYDLKVSQTFNDIEGTAADATVSLDFSNTFHQVEGHLPCGKIDLQYSLNFKEISGEVCGNHVDIDVDTAEDVIPTFKDIVFDELLVGFPLPARGAVREFISRRIRF